MKRHDLEKFMAGYHGPDSMREKAQRMLGAELHAHGGCIKRSKGGATAAPSAPYAPPSVMHSTAVVSPSRMYQDPARPARRGGRIRKHHYDDGGMVGMSRVPGTRSLKDGNFDMNAFQERSRKFLDDAKSRGIRPAGEDPRTWGPGWSRAPKIGMAKPQPGMMYTGGNPNFDETTGTYRKAYSRGGRAPKMGFGGWFNAPQEIPGRQAVRDYSDSPYAKRKAMEAWENSPYNPTKKSFGGFMSGVANKAARKVASSFGLPEYMGGSKSIMPVPSAIKDKGPLAETMYRMPLKMLPHGLGNLFEEGGHVHSKHKKHHKHRHEHHYDMGGFVRDVGNTVRHGVEGVGGDALRHLAGFGDDVVHRAANVGRGIRDRAVSGLGHFLFRSARGGRTNKTYHYAMGGVGKIRHKEATSKGMPRHMQAKFSRQSKGF